jgi:hypothetical protein
MQIKVYFNPDSVTSARTYRDEYKPKREELEYVGTIEIALF